MQKSALERQFFDLATARGLRPAGATHIERTLRTLAAFFAGSLLREETARRPALLQQVDPRARLICTLLFLISVSLARTLPSLLVHAALPCAALVLSRIRLREFLGAGFLAATAFSLLITLPATVNLVVGGQMVLPLLVLEQGWQVGPFVTPAVIGISREGLLTGATLLLRVLSSVAAVLWLTLSTRWVDVLRALRTFALPPIFLQVLGMTVRYLHLFHHHSQEMHLGKKSRTVCRAARAAEQAWVGSRIANAWERGVHLMGEVGEAMLARGFRGEARFPPGMRFRTRDWGMLLIVMLACAAAHLA